MHVVNNKLFAAMYFALYFVVSDITLRKQVYCITILYCIYAYIVEVFVARVHGNGGAICV